MADSQLLFSRDSSGQYFLESVTGDIGKANIKAAYIGWSNGDLPEFYELFKEGMKNLRITDCQMISSGFTATDRKNLQEADLILLAGGDVKAGWKRLSETGAIEIIKEKYVAGSVLIGISAGAIQLGLQMPVTANDPSVSGMEMMKFVPFIIDAHDEEHQWHTLQNTVRMSGRKGIGIPFGSGCIYHPDQQIESLNKPIKEFS